MVTNPYPYFHLCCPFTKCFHFFIASTLLFKFISVFIILCGIYLIIHSMYDLISLWLFLEAKYSFGRCKDGSWQMFHATNFLDVGNLKFIQGLLFSFLFMGRLIDGYPFHHPIFSNENKNIWWVQTFMLWSQTILYDVIFIFIIKNSRDEGDNQQIMMPWWGGKLDLKGKIYLARIVPFHVMVSLPNNLNICNDERSRCDYENKREINQGVLLLSW